MKATDLMIGDWVVYDGDVDYSGPIKVEGMDIASDMLITSDRDNVGFNGVQPIPLTLDIINKNGATYDEKSDCFYFHGLYIDFYGNDAARGTIDVGFMGNEFQPFIHLEHVHELQHMLRLCGINKEIELSTTHKSLT